MRRRRLPEDDGDEFQDGGDEFQDDGNIFQDDGDDSDDDGKISERNEIEVYALVAGELDEAAYQAKQGISEADDRKDAVVKAYLQGRYQTLQKGIDWLKEKYPDLF